MPMSDVLEFLKDQSGRVFSVKEVGKEVDPDRYDRDKTWAASELLGLCSKGLIAAINGCYWIAPESDKNARRLEEEREEQEKERLAALSGEDPLADKTEE